MKKRDCKGLLGGVQVKKSMGMILRNFQVSKVGTMIGRIIDMKKILATDLETSKKVKVGKTVSLVADLLFREDWGREHYKVWFANGTVKVVAHVRA